MSAHQKTRYVDILQAILYIHAPIAETQIVLSKKQSPQSNVYNQSSAKHMSSNNRHR